MRETFPAEIASRRYDLVVIGAGINGAGIARDAAMRGLRVLLLDKGDLAGGTSSGSSRLIHGGLRYLEHGEIRLVRESLREREALLRNAPHLVAPLPMAIPLYANAQRGPRVVRAGMAAYDALSFDKSLPRHRVWSRAKALRMTPGLNPEGLLGEAVYYDAQATFPERLVVENTLSAVQHGAVVRTYARVIEIERAGQCVSGVVAADERSGETFRVAARAVVNVAGPWVDEVLTGAA
ncbi:MAG: FAD-dependent oxidoreductase, partial [Thermomicrobiales bacterium]|nr:FAD-dependent oxidoreductase [Thermomicrobiales bacterium]